MDDPERKLVADVFDLVRRTGIEKLISFKNELDLQSLGSQIESLFNEVHEFTVSVCVEKLSEIESRKALQNESRNKRVKLTDKLGDQLDSHLTACDVLSDFLFELMNQGVYADVGVHRRYAFGLITLYVSLIELHKQKFGSVDFVLGLLNKIDYGLLYSPPFLNKMLARIATRLHDYLIIRRPIDLDYNSIDSDSDSSCNSNVVNQEAGRQSMSEQSSGQSSSHLDRSKQIKRVKCIDLDDFYANYFVPKIPVIIEKAIDDWPSVHNWNLNYLLRRAAYRLVPVEIGSRYTDVNWNQKVITVKEFVDKFIVNPREGDPKGYCAQYELFERIEQLSNDFFIPDFCALSDVEGGGEEGDEPNDEADREDVHINAW